MDGIHTVDLTNETTTSLLRTLSPQCSHYRPLQKDYQLFFTHPYRRKNKGGGDILAGGGIARARRQEVGIKIFVPDFSVKQSVEKQ